MPDITPDSDDETPPTPDLSLYSSLPSPSKISSLKSPHSAATSRIPVAFATFSGSVHFAFVDPIDGSIDSEAAVAGKVHRGPVSGLDMAESGGGECVSVGMDGRVNVVGVVGGEGGEHYGLGQQGAGGVQRCEVGVERRFCNQRAWVQLVVVGSKEAERLGLTV